jgi:hypothetical protein
MDTTLTTLLAGGVLAAHGIGHTLGWLPAFGVAAIDGVSSRSWVLTGPLGDTASRVVAGTLFLVPMAGFLLAAGGLVTGQPWWRQVAVASAVCSLAATALYPQAFPTSSTFGSVAANVIVLAGILVLGWGARAAA